MTGGHDGSNQTFDLRIWFSTFTGPIDANGNLDVDGHRLDDVNVSGITTSGLLDINAGAQANTLKVEDLTDNHVVIAAGGDGGDQFNFQWNSTCCWGNLDVDGHTELDDVNVSGASTFVGAIDANGGLDVSGGDGLVASSAKFLVLLIMYCYCGASGD